MKKLQCMACIFICIMMLFCACTPNTPATEPSSETAPQADMPTAEPWLESEPSSEVTLQADLSAVEPWLEKDCSFTLTYEYMNLAINGMQQKSTQSFAADGSWSFKNEQKIWDHTYDYEVQVTSEFFYRYENSQLVCYSSIDGQTPQYAVLSDSEKAAMDESKTYMVGVPALLPEYLQELSVTQADDTTVFAFQLPVEKVLADNTILSVFLQNVFSLSGNEYKAEYNAMILCTLETDPQTHQPKTLSYDFSQVKPYVLSAGAQSGESAFDGDFLTMTYFFDYALPDTLEVPTHLIP